MVYTLYGNSARHNHLNPHISKAPWTDVEDRTILESHQELGNRWAEIAKVNIVSRGSLKYSEVKYVLTKKCPQFLLTLRQLLSRFRLKCPVS